MTSRHAAAAVSGDDVDLVVELRPLVVRTVRLTVGAGSPVAEDAAQEALIELQRALPRLRDRNAARAFAARIAMRVALKAARRERRFALLGISSQLDLEPHAPGLGPAELLELKRAFDALPPRQRGTAVLRLYVGLSEEETAMALNCSIGTVKRQLHDARKALRSQLGLDDGDIPNGGRGR